MRTSVRLELAALLAAVLLSGAVSDASARALSLSEASFRTTWGSLEFAAGVTVRCRVTLEGSYHIRTMTKVVALLIGAVTRATVGHPCTGGEAWFDNGTETEPLGTAPNRPISHLQYGGFSGTLPAFGRFREQWTRISFVISDTTFGLSCRGRYGRLEDVIEIAAEREAGGAIGSLGVSGSASLVEQLGASAVCPAAATLAGTGTMSNLSSGARITITLI
jgi:hypothetical protein